MRSGHAHVISHRLPQLRTLIHWIDRTPIVMLRAALYRLCRGSQGDDESDDDQGVRGRGGPRPPPFECFRAKGFPVTG
jgi:hypothetical protein